MSKFTDTTVTTLKGYFESGDQPTAAQFAELIDKIQQGIEEHDHNALGDGDAANVAAAGISDRTRKVFVQCPGGWSASEQDHLVAQTTGHRLEYGYYDTGSARWRVPEDFVSGLTVKAVVVPDTAGSGDIYVKNRARYGASGESWDTHDDVTGFSAITVTADEVELVASISLTSAAAGDFIFLSFERDSTHASDTYTEDAYLAGWLFSYTADS